MLDPRYYAAFASFCSMLQDEPIFTDFPFTDFAVAMGALMALLTNSRDPDAAFKLYYDHMISYVQLWIGDRYTIKFDLEIIETQL